MSNRDKVGRPFLCRTGRTSVFMPNRHKSGFYALYGRTKGNRHKIKKGQKKIVCPGKNRQKYIWHKINGIKSSPLLEWMDVLVRVFVYFSQTYRARWKKQSHGNKRTANNTGRLHNDHHRAACTPHSTLHSSLESRSLHTKYMSSPSVGCGLRTALSIARRK